MTLITPLSSALVIKFMRDTLKHVLGGSVNNVTMHSLRCSAVQSADTAGDHGKVSVFDQQFIIGFCHD